MFGSETIFLRIAEPEDLDFMLLTENNPEYWHVSGTQFPYSRFELESFILNNSHDLFSEKQIRLMICLNHSAQPIGMVDLFEYHPMHRRAGLGIIVDERFRNQGMASQALTLVSDYAENTLQLHQLFCEVHANNTASLHLFEKSGFVKVGLKNQWEFVNRQWQDVFFLQKLF